MRPQDMRHLIRLQELVDNPRAEGVARTSVLPQEADEEQRRIGGVEGNMMSLLRAAVQ